jgi:hypothetical protein
MLDQKCVPLLQILDEWKEKQQNRSDWQEVKVSKFINGIEVPLYVCWCVDTHPTHVRDKLERV